jgi:hypothetical protein
MEQDETRGRWEGMRVAGCKNCEGKEVAYVKERKDRAVGRDERSRKQ